MAKKPVLSHKETMELVAEAQKGSESAREKLVECNTRLIWSAIQRFKNRGFELDDLFQFGAIGFIKAINKFDMSFNVRFSTYAVPMIIGEIQRFIRDDGIIKVSRTTRELANKIRIQKLEKTPLEEIKEILVDYTLEQIKEALGYLGNMVLSTEETIYSGKDGEDITLGDQLAGDANGNNWAEHIELHNALEQLEPREKQIMELRYFKDYTQTETAKVLQISQVQISRLEKTILQKMKRLMEDETMSSYTVKDKNEAIRLLKKTTLTYKQISEATGVPVPTICIWSKEHRDPEVTAANMRKGQVSKKVKKDKSKDKPKEKVKPIDTPVINEPAFMGDKDREALEKKNAKIKSFDPVGTVTGRFQSDKPNKSIEPKTINEAIVEFREEIKKELREEVEAEVNMSLNRYQAEPGFLGPKVELSDKKVEPITTLASGVFSNDERGNLFFSPKKESIAPLSEKAVEDAYEPKVKFSTNTSFSGIGVSKDKAVESLYEAYNLVKQLPTDTITVFITVKN